MVEFDIDRLDVVLDPDIIFCKDSSNTSQEDPNTGEEAAEAVPSGEVFPPRDLLVQINGSEPAGCGQQGEQVEYPGDEDHLVHVETNTQYSPVKLNLVGPLGVVKK